MASCEAETTKKSIKTKLEAEIVSLSMFSKLLKLRIIVMSTNLEYSERERQKTKEQISEAQARKRATDS